MPWVLPTRRAYWRVLLSCRQVVLTFTSNIVKLKDNGRFFSINQLKLFSSICFFRVQVELEIVDSIKNYENQDNPWLALISNICICHACSMYTAPVDYLFISLSAVQSFSTGGETSARKGQKDPVWIQRTRSICSSLLTHQMQHIWNWVTLSRKLKIHSQDKCNPDS